MFALLFAFTDVIYICCLVCIYVCTHVCTRQGTVREKEEIIRAKDEIIQRVVREKDKVIKRLKVSAKPKIRLVMRSMFSYLLLLQYHGATCQGRGVGRSAQL